MATIKISDLHTAGSELLLDSESYLNELTNEEGLSVLGGALAGALVSNFAVYDGGCTIGSGYILTVVW